MKILSIISYTALLCIGYVSLFTSSVFAGPLEGLTRGNSISKLTQDSNKVIDSSYILGQPILEGVDVGVGKVTYNGSATKNNPSPSLGIFTFSRTNYEGVLSATLLRVQKFTNRSLGFLALICVIYLVYQGVMMLMNFDDDKAQSEGLGSIKTVAWVLGGIGLSWFIISTAFYVTRLLAG